MIPLSYPFSVPSKTLAAAAGTVSVIVRKIQAADFFLIKYISC